MKILNTLIASLLIVCAPLWGQVIVSDAVGTTVSGQVLVCSPGTPSSPLPTPPSNAVTFTGLQNVSGNPGTWTQCSGTTCAGGTNTGSGSNSFGNTSPSLSGSSMSQTSNGNGFNTMYYRYLGCAMFPGGICSDITSSIDDLWFYIPSTSNHLIALEFDPDLRTSHYQFFASMQCDSVTGDWRYWDGGTMSWSTSVYPCGLLTETNTWHHYQLYVTYNVAAHTYSYQTFVVDGVTVFQNLNKTFSGSADTIENFNVQQQIDNNSTATSNTIYYDNYKLTVWGW